MSKCSCQILDQVGNINLPYSLNIWPNVTTHFHGFWVNFQTYDILHLFSQGENTPVCQHSVEGLSTRSENTCNVSLDMIEYDADVKLLSGVQIVNGDNLRWRHLPGAGIEAEYMCFQIHHLHWSCSFSCLTEPRIWSLLLNCLWYVIYI